MKQLEVIVKDLNNAVFKAKTRKDKPEIVFNEEKYTSTLD